MSKMYSLQVSPLYRMRNRRKLAILLGLSEDYFKCEHKYEYNTFSRLKANGKDMRYFAVPADDLKIIQKKICKLLSRIETPDWVMTGKKHCSYIYNAERHKDNAFVKTMDISQFYDSAQRSHIYKMFVDTFKMSNDIAWLMTNLVTYENKLPTGSPSSQMVVYWTYSRMFDEIYKISQRYQCEFTLYVDDMTFSSRKPINKQLRQDVAYQLKMNGLKAKPQKDHYYQAGKLKEVTGVGLKDGRKIVLNRKRKQILEQFNKCKKSSNILEIEKLNGMLCALRQIEPDIFPEIANYLKHYEEKLKHMARNRYYRMLHINKKRNPSGANVRISSS